MQILAQTLPKITLKQLAVFVSIYQTGSTSSASEQLHLSQSAVSSALTELESRLQMPLFERVGRRLNPHPNAIKHMVSADIGLGCLSQHVIEAELAAGKLVCVKVAGIDLARTWWLVWHKARHQSPIWQSFIDIISDD